METFLQTSFQNVRSDKRTDVLHTELLDEMLNTNPAWAEYDWKFEYRLPIDALGGTFDLDIAGFIGEELKVAILAKAMNSNIAKNIKNYANTTIGEAARLMLAPDINLEKVLFITISPRVAPRFKKSGLVEGFDNVLSSKSRTKVAPVLTKQYGDKVQAIDLMYDIQDVRQKKTRDDFSAIIIENLDELVIA
jgi:hypothetical protein